jgi:acyl-CoA synthetase (AMP-forming)/AMP-acid ligase II
VLNVAAELLATGAPSDIAIIDGRQEITYQEMRERVNRVARMLLARGCSRQERVAIVAENGIFFAVAYLAVVRAGLVAVPLQTDAPTDTAARVVADAGIRLILASERFALHAAEWVRASDIAVLSIDDVFGASSSPHDVPLPEGSAPRDLAALMFTSGSTGRPKGVMVTHENIASNTAEIVRYMDLSSRDRAMVVLPFYYCFGLSLLHTHLAVGGSVVINNQFMYPENVLQEINARSCTGLAGVPSTYQILLRRSRITQRSFPTLRWFQQAGGRLPNPCIRQIVEAFPATRFFVMYGQTEATARLSYLPPSRVIEKLGSIGMGLPGTRLDVIRANGTPVTRGSDEIGEVVATGDNIALGYWNDPDETAKYFRDGRLYTGDLARVDGDGCIYLVEREREMVKSGGNRVGTKEVEDVIAELGDVVETAVVGVPHDVMGEAIVAFAAVNRSAGTIGSILEHCRRRLPASRVPEAIVQLRELPHGGSGKVLKPVLRTIAIGLLQENATHSDVLHVELKGHRPGRQSPEDLSSRDQSRFRGRLSSSDR